MVLKANIFLQLARNIVALQVDKRCCTFYHTPRALLRNKILLLQVEAACCMHQVELASTFFNKFFQLATTNFVALQCFEVGGNTCNNASQLAMQQCCVALVAAICCSYYFTFTVIDYR